MRQRERVGVGERNRERDFACVIKLNEAFIKEEIKIITEIHKLISTSLNGKFIFLY